MKRTSLFLLVFFLGSASYPALVKWVDNLRKQKRRSALLCRQIQANDVEGFKYALLDAKEHEWWDKNANWFILRAIDQKKLDILRLCITDKDLNIDCTESHVKTKLGKFSLDKFIPSPFMYALFKDDEEVAQLLLKYGVVDLNSTYIVSIDRYIAKRSCEFVDYVDRVILYENYCKKKDFLLFQLSKGKDYLFDLCDIALYRGEISNLNKFFKYAVKKQLYKDSDKSSFQKEMVHKAIEEKLPQTVLRLIAAGYTYNKQELQFFESSSRNSFKRELSFLMAQKIIVAKNLN